MRNTAQFVVATPQRGVCDDNARALQFCGRLHFHALGTRRGATGVSADNTRLLPIFGLAAYAATRLLPPFQAESFRFRMLPFFDQWVKAQLKPGDHIISSYGYVNSSFKWVHSHGGKTFIDAGNSHPEHYWKVVQDEYQRWGCTLPPFPKCWYERSKAMLPDVDYVLSPSRYVTESFLDRGFQETQILRNIYPVDLRFFSAAKESRPKDRPFTIISTAGPSLRKGAPYLLEAFRSIREQVPNARLLITDSIHPSLLPLMHKWADLPITWLKPAPHSVVADRLRSADIFILPSLEEGLVRTAIEAMACGLPVIVTRHCGANDLVEDGINGSIVSIRSSSGIAEKALYWWEKIQNGIALDTTTLRHRLSYEVFADKFISQLHDKDLV